MKKEKNIETPAKSETVADEAKEAKNQKETPKAKPAKVTKVGAMLKEMRLQQGLKLADIAKRLCIRKLYLDAIEESNYKAIPPQPYGIGFIRSYANFLGLNGENIVELYKEETNISEPKDMHVLEPQPEASMPSMQYIIISLLAIVLIYLGWSSFSGNSNLAQEETLAVEQSSVTDDNSAGVIVVEDFNFEPPVEQDTTAEPTVVPSQNDTPQVKVVEQSYQESPENETEVRDEAIVAEPKTDTQVVQPEQPQTLVIPQEGVFIEVLKETWVEVKDASKLYLSKVLYKGDTYKVPDGAGMILSFGNYDGANVYINGVLTKVARPNKKTNIALDPLLDANH